VLFLAVPYKIETAPSFLDLKNFKPWDWRSHQGREAQIGLKVFKPTAQQPRTWPEIRWEWELPFRTSAQG